jgi:hypothetical protein
MCGGVCWILRTPVRMAELRVAQQVSQAKLLGMQHRGKRGAHRMHERPGRSNCYQLRWRSEGLAHISLRSA